MWKSACPVILTLASAGTALAVESGEPFSPSFPYARSGVFASFVAESFRVAGAKNADREGQTFFNYLGSFLPAEMDATRARLGKITAPRSRADAERVACAELHRLVKRQIPRFSLDRGFEFRHTVRFGERQCFLQSVLIASLLQRAGISAGVAMVSRNPKGEYCNNAHAVTVARLSDGTNIVVDASERTPFVQHQGLMVHTPAQGGYSYVEPQYDNSHRITVYRSQRTGKTISPTAIRMLDVSFLRSQFTYYRGERTPGGLWTPPLATSTGLAGSEKWLRRSISECPQNPLPLFLLGKVQERQGKVTDARASYHNAFQLYARYGWVPPEQVRALAAIKKKATPMTAPR